MTDFNNLYEAVLKGKFNDAKPLTQELLEGGATAQEVIQHGIIPAMEEIGGRFEAKQCFVPELLLAAKAVKSAFELLQPLLVGSGTRTVGRVAIGTVKGDLHDIGKNIVASMLEGSGFEVLNLGVDVQPSKFVEAVEQSGCNIVAMSALLTTTMPSMKATVEALRDAGLLEKVKVIIGGPSVTHEYCETIGADGYGDNASSAVSLAKRMIAEQRGLSG